MIMVSDHAHVDPIPDLKRDLPIPPDPLADMKQGGPDHQVCNFKVQDQFVAEHCSHIN